MAFDPIAARRVMVKHDLLPSGVEDARVLEVMGRMPREKFVDPRLRSHAYADRPLPIAEDQTISQPAIVGIMLQLLGVEGDARVLEVGTGSGYQTALLSQLANEVWTIERHASLSEAAQNVLRGIDVDNVHFRVGDGHIGWPQQAPFDCIVVSAAPEVLPAALPAQLSDGGRLVIPMGPMHAQDLWVIERHGDSFDQRRITSVRFVPLVPGEV